MGSVDHRRIALAVVPLLLAACTSAQATAGATGGLGSPTPPTTPPPPSATFVGSVRWIDDALRHELIGRNWHPGCPVPIRDLRLVTVSYWTFGGRVERGPLIINETVADDVLSVFHRLFDGGFPIRKIALAAKWRPPRPSDWLSTKDVSASFSCRPVTGQTSGFSQHAYGWAIDINPTQNPYVTGAGEVLRKACLPYVDRTQHLQGMIHPNDVVVQAFTDIGWGWGGDWHSLKDYMHFSLTGT
jgi:hypothetical protein